MANATPAAANQRPHLLPDPSPSLDQPSILHRAESAPAAVDTLSGVAASRLTAHELTGIIHCPLDVLRRHRHRAGDRRRGARERPRLPAADRPRHARAQSSNGEEGWHGSVLVLVGEEVSPYRRNHYLAFGLSRADRPPGPRRPRRSSQRVNEAGGFGFPAHPFSRGSERFRRGGQGMPWDDLEADGYTGIELWSFVTDTAERVNSIGDLLRFVATPQRFLDHPPRRNLDEWDRLCRAPAVRRAGRRRRAPDRDPRRRPRAAAADGVQALVPPPAHAPARRASRCGTSSSATATAVFGALRAGHAFLAVDSIAPAHGFRFWAEGDDAALTMGDEAPAGDWTLRVRLPAPARVRLMRDGAEVGGRERHDPRARARRDRACTGSRPTATPRARAHLDPLEPDLPALSRRRSRRGCRTSA